MNFQATIEIILLLIGPTILVCLLLMLSTIASKVILAILRPITNPLENGFRKINDALNSIADCFAPYRRIKDFFGNWKLFIFMIIITIYLLITIIPVCIAGNFSEFWEQLLPNTALGIFQEFLDHWNELDSYILASNTIAPETYMRVIIVSVASGFFLTACNNKKSSDAHIHWSIQILYLLLFVIFSAIVMTKLPADFLVLSDFKINLQIQPHELESYTITENSKLIPSLIYMIRVFLESIWIPLFNKFISLIPVFVGIYFFCSSLSGVAASVLGGGLTIILCIPLHSIVEGLANSSTGYVFLAFLLLSISEFAALLLIEFLNDLTEGLIDEVIVPLLEKYVNLFSIMTSYFTLPLLGYLILFIVVGGREVFRIPAAFLLCIILLLMYILLCLPGFFYYRSILDRGSIIRTIFIYLGSMIFNIPTWIMYFVFFDLFQLF